MTKVHTIKGLIDRDRLTVKDLVTEDENARTIATEWFLNGDLVRRDAHVIILRGHELAGEQAEIA